jgi:alanyl-tRNA synthetase
MLDELIDKAKARGTTLSGDDVFLLHDTYGFPSELTREVAAEAGIGVDDAAFEAAMDAQRRRARDDARSKRAVVQANLDEDPADWHTLPPTEFTGYGGLETDGTIVGIIGDKGPLEEIGDGARATLVLDRTPFYAEKGGQIGDRGAISANGARFEVEDTQFTEDGKHVGHHGVVRGGSLSVREPVHAAVAPQWREEIRREHSSAHLLQRALKDVLGDDVVQAGSWVGIDRMRFDFRSPALTPEQRAAVQRRVNELIRADYHRDVVELPIEQARLTGAVTMAGEDYGDRVRIVTFGPSKEFCGGTHAETSGELGMFIIVSESSIGSGIRRIESVVSKAAEAYVERQAAIVATLSEALSSKPDELQSRVVRLQTEVREAQRNADEMRARMAGGEAAELVEKRETVAGKTLVAAVVQGADADALRRLGGAVREKLRSGVVALAGVQNGTVALLVTVSDELAKDGVHAGNLLKGAAALVDGKGGGQATQAQGGGRNPAGAQAALDAIRAALAT